MSTPSAGNDESEPVFTAMSALSPNSSSSQWYGNAGCPFSARTLLAAVMVLDTFENMLCSHLGMTPSHSCCAASSDLSQ